MDRSIVRSVGAELFRALKPVALGVGILFGCYAIYLGLFGSPPSGGPLLWTGLGVVFVLQALWYLLRSPSIAESVTND